MQIITNQFQKELKSHGSDAFPLLVSYERLSRYESGSFAWHWHPELEFTIVQSGQMLYKVNQASFHLKEGDILIGNSNALHAGFMENMQDCDYISVTCSPKMIYGFSQSAVYTKYVEPFIQNFSLPALFLDGSENWHQPAAALLCEIVALDRDRPDFFELDITILLKKLWKLIISNMPPLTAHSPQAKSRYDRVREIVTFIELNYMRKISIGDIASHICMSENACSQLFKQYMNVSLVSFLQEYRIEKSLDYLSGDYTLNEIAEKIGFSSPFYYSTVFTKIKGLSPQKYRKLYLGSPDADTEKP